MRQLLSGPLRVIAPGRAVLALVLGWLPASVLIAQTPPAVPSHDLDAFMVLLKRDGGMCLVGVPAEPHPSPSVGNLVMKRRTLAGSLIGGIAETQEMLDFCAEHGIVSEVETIRMQDIEDAYARMLKSDVKYRFSIDISTMDG